MRPEEIFRNIACDKVAKITGDRQELEQAAALICDAATAKSISVLTRNHAGSLYIWRRPTVCFVPKSCVPFLSK